MQIFLCGLYRSGTTITWRTISQDKNLQSFDEPFNEGLEKLPQINHMGSNDTYLSRFDEDNALFFNKLSPILPPQDLKTNFTQKQKQYLQWLIAPYQAVNIDFTRCNFKLEQLREMYPNALIIHLKRNAPAFVSSHIMTSYKAKGLRAQIGRWYRKNTFFTRRNRYNFYNYEKIIEKYEPAQFNYLLAQLKQHQGQKLQDLPAFVKMLLLHKHNQNVVDAFSNKHPENFLEWQFEEFTRQPEEHLKQIYSHFNQTMPHFNFEHLRTPNLGYLPDSEKWNIFL